MNETNGQLEHDSSRRRHETFLAIILTLFMGGGFLLFLIFVSGGFFFYVLLISGAVGLFGCLHYLLWGRSFSQAAQGEREEAELREQMEQDWWAVRPPGERRF
jgi:hypothetical protein